MTRQLKHTRPVNQGDAILNGDTAHRQNGHRPTRDDLEDSGYPTRMHFSDLDPTPVEYLIDGLLVAGGKLMFNAYAKSGKTTTMMHMLKSLDTGRNFLGKTVTPASLPWLYVCLEMRQDLLRQYARDAGLDLSSRRLFTADFCGRALALLELLTEPSLRASKQMFGGLGGVILDPLAPLCSANGIDSDNNDQVRQLLDQIEQTVMVAHGVPQLVVVDHTGHGDKTRGRGASAKRDWPDAIWTQERKPEHEVAKLTTVGRGIMPSTLHFSRDGGELVPCDAKADARLLPEDEFVTLWKTHDEHPELSVRDLAIDLGWDKSKVQRMLKDDRFKRVSLGRDAEEPF